jgi:acetyl esterase/lipase
MTMVVAAVLLGGTAAAAPAAGAAPAATVHAAPTPPAPGTVIRSEPMAAPAGANAWRVLYHSRNLAGDDIAVSGFVVAPDGPAPKRGRPVVAWAHGTTGLADACAPSVAPDPVAGVPFVDDLLAAGYVVAATDYEGLGTPGVHPYLVGESEGRSVLDAVRAARTLPVGAGRRVAVLGHSQGGHAALFAGEIAQQYAPELSVRAVAAGAPVADVGAFLDFVVDSPGRAGFVPMAVAGSRAAYPELGAVSVLSADAQARSEVAVSECGAAALAAFADGDGSTLLGPDRRAPAWLRRLQENTAGRRPSAAPVLVWQGGADDLTPEPLAAAYVTRACAHGTPVGYRIYPDANHGTVFGAARADVLAFLGARFARAGVADDCPG